MLITESQRFYISFAIIYLFLVTISKFISNLVFTQKDCDMLEYSISRIEDYIPLLTAVFLLPFIEVINALINIPVLKVTLLILPISLFAISVVLDFRRYNRKKEYQFFLFSTVILKIILATICILIIIGV